VVVVGVLMVKAGLLRGKDLPAAVLKGRALRRRSRALVEDGRETGRLRVCGEGVLWLFVGLVVSILVRKRVVWET
jgi:hypothetical protein